MTDNTQDRSKSQGQQGIDKDIEQRNRENETGQQQNQQFGQQGQPSPSGQDRGEGFGKEAGQAVERSETDLASRSEETGKQDSTGLGSSPDTGFVGTGKEDSSDYLTKGEQGQDFAKEGQGAQDTSAGKTDIETGQSTGRDESLDDGTSGNR